MAAEQQSAEQFRGQARLPGFAAPRRYDLRLAPDLAACAFAGSVAVDLRVAAPTRFLPTPPPTARPYSVLMWTRVLGTDDENCRRPQCLAPLGTLAAAI